MTETEQSTETPSAAVEKAFSLRGPTPRVMRLSRKALAAIGVAAGLSIGGALIYALRPATPNHPQELLNTDSRATPDMLNSAPKDYSQVPKLGPPLPGDLGPPILSAQQRGKDVPIPPVGANPPPPDPHEQAIEAARQRVAQERDAARTSNVFLLGSAAPTAASQPMPVETAVTSPLPTKEASSQAVSSPSTTDRQQAFLDRQSGPMTSAARLTAPLSPDIVQAGTIIPAALITGISSDLPGQIAAQVTENVYDSPTGRILLIPQGARLIGNYDSETSFGQNRVLLAWDRLILPDGRSISLDRQPGADAAGMSGLSDRTSQHWGGVFKAALISTLLGIGAELGAGNEGDLVRALRQGSQDTISQAGQQIVQRQLSVKPTLTVRPGYPLRVVVTRDLVLEPIGDAR